MQAKFGAALLVPILVLAACGSNSQSESTVAECGPRILAVPIVGHRISDDRSSIRAAYTGDDPCQFAVTMHKGNLYFSLLSTGDKQVTGDAGVGCVEIPLDPPIPADARTYPVGTARSRSAATVANVLAGRSGCLRVPEGQPNFVID